MERPERPSRHSKNHDKWKRIVQPSGDSDSSSEWSSDSENMRPDVRYFGSTEHGDTLVGIQSGNRNTFECTSVNLQPSTSSSVPFQLDLQSVFPIEGKRKRVDVTDTTTPSSSNNSHLLHHDYAVGDTYKPNGVDFKPSGADTYGWPWYVRPSSTRKRVRFALPDEETAEDTPSSNGDNLDQQHPKLTSRQITVASLSETLPTAAENKRLLRSQTATATTDESTPDRESLFTHPLFKIRRKSYDLGNQRFDWTRKYSEVLNELEASTSAAPPVTTTRTEDGGEVQVIAMAGPSTSTVCPRVRPDTSEEVIIVEDQQPTEIPVTESLAPTIPITLRSETPTTCTEEEPLNQALIGLLECPVCFEYMRPPIHQCRRGHLVCSHCKPKLQACPTCRSRLSESRNLCMEKVADKLQYPCKNAPEGCSDFLRLRDKECHEASCDFRSYRCCFTGCDWKGFHENTLPHYTLKHPDKVLFGSEQTLRVQLGDLSTSTNQNWIISTLDELFRVNFITVKSQPRATLFDTGTRLQVFGCVQYIGACKKADNFKYKLESKKFDGRMWRSAIYKRATHNDTKKCINFYSSGDSFCIRGDTAELLSERLAGETTLVVRVKVQPANEVTTIM